MNVNGSRGSDVQLLEGEGSGEPLRVCRASVIRECNKRSWEEMKMAEWRSPVQRVMSTQSRDWSRRLRRATRGVSTIGWSGLRTRWIGYWVRRRRFKDFIWS